MNQKEIESKAEDWAAAVLRLKGGKEFEDLRLGYIAGYLAQDKKQEQLEFDFAKKDE